ncbi:DNA-dependent protein kinase catalytic subunit [Selaginella moellendorffii]|nr:DNA-dependent protein kinase catalytic subunit [Selaginella moellendorffii]|eukprot:XP_002965996.2 DNA-dependent protein kinase catalytic subunit [Selaginella moellendorffii]
MDSKVSQYLAALNSEAEEALKGSETDLGVIVDDLSGFCSQLVSDEDFAFAASAVFDRDTGIFCVVDRLRISRERSVHKAREKCLVFLGEFVRNVGPERASLYCSLIKENALRILRIDETRSVQAAALAPIISLLEIGVLRAGNATSDGLMDWKVAEMLLAEFRKAKTSGSLRANILITLGYSIELFPSLYDDGNVSAVLRLCLNTLEEQLKQSGKDVTFVLIAGAVKCLDSLLQWFDDTVPAGGTIENSKRAYAYLEQVLYYREDMKRYEMIRAGLRLLARHAWRFRLALFKNSGDLLKWLQIYCLHGNASLRSAALPAYDQFVSQISSCLISDDRRIEDPDRTYKALMKHMLDTLEFRQDNPKLVALAIRGIGKLAGPIVKYSGKSDLEKAFQRLVPFVGSFSRGGDSHEELGYAVTVVGAFANIVVYIDRVEDFMVSLITEVTGRIFFQYPSLFPKQRVAIHSTISSLLKALYPKGNLFVMFLMNVVWSSLDRATDTDPASDFLWKSYCDLWCQILTNISEPSHTENLQDDDGIVGVDLAVLSVNVSDLKTTIFDSLIRSIMKLMMELNLKYRVKDLNKANSSEFSGQEPEAEAPIEPLDKNQMLKYLNLVDFVLRLFASDHASLMEKWIFPFCRCLIDLSRKYPLISGFYKLLAAVISIGDQKGYFEKDQSSHVMIQEFLHEVLITSRRYKLELLGSCLHLCLSCPPTLLDLASIVRPLKLALKIGLRYHPLANIALDSLQRWYNLHPKELQKQLQDIVPCLRDYLFEVADSRKKTMDSKTLKLLEKEKTKVVTFEDIQVRVQRFIGQIGAYGHFLVPDANLLQSSGTGGLSWDVVDRIKFTVPLRDEKLDIWLDCLLPRIVELAKSSSDRKIKVLSSELLHAMCLLMLGNAAKGPLRTRNDETNLGNYVQLYRKLFPSVLWLATDVEPVTQQLFSEFAMQLIHWMTSNTQKENPETMALLDAILEGLVDAENGSLRELCSRCFSEFLRWSIRHAPPEASNFVNVTSMLRRLYNRMDHPSPYHRLGASMAAYQIYPILRQNSSIVDRYIFELAFFLLKSLRVGDTDAEQIGTIKQAYKALDGIEKLIVRNISLLQKNKKDRVLFCTLEDFMTWLFEQTKLSHERCRTKCMALLSAVCSALPGGSCVHWFRERFTGTQRLHMLAGLFEKLPSNIFTAKSMPELSTALHSLHWYLGAQMIGLEEIEPLRTQIFSRINQFVEKLPARCIPLKENDSAILHLMALFKDIIQMGTGASEPSSVETPSRDDKEKLLAEILPLHYDKLQHLLCLLLFKPSEMTTFTPESSGAEELRMLVSSVLWSLTRISPGFKDGLVQVLREMLNTFSEFDISTLELHQITEGRLSQSMNLVKAYQHLHTVGALVPTLGKERSEQLSERLLHTVYTISKEPVSPLAEPLYVEIIRLSVALRVVVDQLLRIVLDKNGDTVDRGTDSVTPGGRFYLSFRKVVIQQVKFFYKKCLPVLMKESVRNETARLILHAVLDEYQGETITRGSFVGEFLLHLTELRPCYLDGSSVTDKQFIAGIIHKLLVLDKASVVGGSQPAFQFILEVLFAFLSATTLGVWSECAMLRKSALLLVPFFLEESMDSSLRTRLIGSLTSLVTSHLLVREADLPDGSMERTDYLGTLDLLIGAIVSSRNLDALEVLFPLLQNPTGLTTPPLSEALRAYAQNIGDKRVTAFSYCMDVLKDATKLPRLRKAVLDYFFVPLICLSPVDTLTGWFTPRVPELMDSLGRTVMSPDVETEQELLLAKIYSYTLLELLFTQVDKERITFSYQQLMKFASNDTRGKNDPRVYPFQENVSVWRDLHVSAYTCLAAVVMCTQKDEKIFNLLFKDAGNPLWQHLVDCSKVYSSFPVQTSTLVESHAIVKGIRAMIKGHGLRRGTSSMTLSSQYLVGMSTSQEPTVISSFVGDNSMASLPETDENVEQAANEQTEEHVEFVALDQDDFDQHPCMGVILRLIDHLHSRFGSPSSQQMPEWMKSIHATLESSSTHANVRLFLGKVVVKARKVFARFSDTFFQPLVNVILHDPPTTGGFSFHYVLRDISITILHWDVKEPTDRHTASRFIDHLMAVAAHESSQVLRANVEIIKAFIQLWKDRVNIDGRLILKYLQAGGKSTNTSDRQLAIQKSVGLQLFATVVSSSGSVNQGLERLAVGSEDVYETLLSNLKLKAKEVFAASADVLGMVLRDKSEDTDLSAVENKFKQFFMSTFKERNYSKCLVILDRLTSKYPPYVGAYIHVLIDLLPRLHGPSKTVALDILLRDPATANSYFNMIVSFLSKLLRHRDPKGQLRSLQLLAEVVKGEADPNSTQKVVLETCDAFVHYETEECRLQFYQMLMFLYETKKLPHDSRIARFLVLGLCDVADGVRQSLQSFWDAHLPENMMERFSHVLNNMHLPDIESHWTPFTNVLLLKLCQRSVDYRRPIFNAPLSDCEFQERQIDSSAVGGSLPMTPLFSEAGSLRSMKESQLAEANASLAIVNHGRGGLIRATASYTPSMTILEGSDEPGQTQNAADGSQNVAVVDPVTRLNRRLYHVKESRAGTLRNVFNATRKRKALQSAEAFERANKVQIMRQYRTGELPDIEIKHEDIIGPMGSLAERDATFARLLLSTIFGAFWQNDVTTVKTEIRTGFENALERTHSESTLVGTIQDLCLKDRDAWIKPEVAGSASYNSQNFHSGILLLEKQILHGTRPNLNAAKRHRGPSGQTSQDNAVTEEAWLELARLYNAIGEDDYVLSLYLNRLTTQSISHQALESQVRGDTDRALVLYDKAINETPEGTASKVEEDLWYNQRLACLVDLTRWGEIMEDALLQVKNDETDEYDLEKLWHPKLQDPYLGLFVKGALKVPTHQSLLTKFLQTSLEDSTKRDVLLQRFGTQVAASAVFNDEIDHARCYLAECYKTFRKRWSALHPLAIGARRLQVRILQRAVELEEFVDFSSRPDRSNISRLLSKWRQRWPSTKRDDVEAWDDILQNRLVFLQKLQGLFNTTPEAKADQARQNFTKQLDEERAFGFLQASRGVMKQGAYCVAQKYMDEYVAVAEKTSFNPTVFKRLVKPRCLQALRTSERDPKSTAAMLEQVLDYVRKQASKPSISGCDDWRRVTMLVESDTSAQLGRTKLDLLIDKDLDTNALSQSMALLGSAYKTYSELLRNADSVPPSREMARTSFKFACFCDDLLNTADDSKWKSEVRRSIQDSRQSFGVTSFSVFREAMVTNMLRTLSMDASVGPQLAVARLISMAGHQEIQAIFSARIDKVPSWIFLGWLPQLLALMDSREGGLFIGILESIAQHFPQALFFPFHVSKDQYGTVGLDRTRKLAATLKSPLFEGLVRALEDLTFPEKRLFDGLCEVKSCLMSGNRTKARETFRAVFADCLDVEAMRNETRQAGEYNVKFARDYSKPVVKALGEDGSKLLQMDEKKFATAIAGVLTSLQKAIKDLPGGKLSLASFSKWMANFDQPRGRGSSSDDLIEIPGQYDGLQCPDVSSHITLVGFDETLISLSSKQRPKILTMRGSDEKEYKFIVKGGEDLRLDQRIEQLFAKMNSVLREDGACAKRELSMRTYAVIPVSQQCGLLQFVDNTCVLDDVIKDGVAQQLAAAKRKEKAGDLLVELRNQYHQWVEKKGGSKSVHDCYKNLYTKVKAGEMEARMNALVAQVPWDALKTGLYKRTSSAESFLAMRSQFARSLSVMSICGYIAGVGDRHLANTLIDMQTGSLVPIDFGYSFGTGVILLPVPELIPFRLTPQLTNVLLPLDSLGLLKNDMVRVLSALHKSRQMICAVMDVFVREPLVDWKKEAARTASIRGGEEESHEQQHVELKIENAQRKLDLWNPAHVTLGELQSSVHAGTPWMPAIEAAVLGDPVKNTRRRIDRKICASVEEQVDCLVDQATDPNLLGRLWVGWQPWM